MRERVKALRADMAFNIIGAIVLLLVVFGILAGGFGYIGFTNAFMREYEETTYHMVDTATTLINGDHLDDYLAGEETEEYARTQGYLDVYCKRMSVSLLYLIQVDRSDYGRFVSIFNSVNNEVDETTYTPWELGYQRDATNDEYSRKYRELYEQNANYETIYRIKTTGGLHPHITTMVPVKNSSGETVAILCMQRPMREIVEARRPYIRRIGIATVLLALAASVLAGLFIRKQFIDPIRRVSDEASRFAKENVKSGELGEFSKFSQLRNLAVSIDTMETDMVNYIETITEAAAERERIGAEMNLASAIQENSIPHEFPAFPERTEFDVFASMDPAKEVGGDFYNFFLVDDDHLALVIGDVSGKGVPAALFMMVSNILLTDRTHMGGGPADILAFVNENICQHNQAEMFVTVWLGILELSTGKLVAANAGHEYPAIRRANGQFELLKDVHGFVVGGMEGMRYKEYELRLSAGDKLFVYTDGVPEAMNAQGELFGTEQMLDALTSAADGPPEAVLKAVRSAVDTFVKDAEQFDDLTMLCLEYRGKESKV